MRIAIPLAGGQLSPHFGHCESFAIFDVNQNDKSILETKMLYAPAHVPGMLPGWLREQGVNVVIAGGMGGRALELFASQSIEVYTGAPLAAPEVLVKTLLEGELRDGGNTCDHGSHECSH